MALTTILVVVIAISSCAASHIEAPAKRKVALALSRNSVRASQFPEPPAPSPSPQAAVVPAAPAGPPLQTAPEPPPPPQAPPQVAPADSALSQEDVADLADEEAKQEAPHLEAAAAASTAKQVAAIDQTAAQADSAGQAAVEQEGNKAMAQQTNALTKMDAENAKEFGKMEGQTKEEAEDTLLKVKDNSEIAATEAARQAVDDVELHAKKEARDLMSQADTMKNTANELADKSLKAAQVSVDAARNSEQWVRELPKKEAENATRFARLSYEISIGLQNQARLVLSLAKMASISAEKSMNISTSAENTAKAADKESMQASQQAAQNAKLLMAIQKQTEQARKDGVEASEKARQAVYYAQQAKMAVTQTKSRKAAAAMRKANNEQETEGLLQEKSRKAAVRALRRGI